MYEHTRFCSFLPQVLIWKYACKWSLLSPDNTYIHIRTKFSSWERSVQLNATHVLLICSYRQAVTTQHAVMNHQTYTQLLRIHRAADNTISFLVGAAARFRPVATCGRCRFVVSRRVGAATAAAAAGRRTLARITALALRALAVWRS